MPGEKPTGVILVSPYRSRDDSPVPGSKLITADCGHLAWISPQGLAFQEKQGVGAFRSVCLDCEHHLDPNRQRYMVPGAVDAVSAAFGEHLGGVITQLLKNRGIKEL